MNHTKTHHTPHKLMSLLLVLVMAISLVPSAFAAQENGYHDPAEHWLTANNRTNELDANAVVTHETFTCQECGKATSFTAFRTPEYTRSGSGALLRGIKYSDGTLIGGSGTGNVDDGTPSVDATYTGYHYTKAVCDTCGTINSNMSKNDYGYGRNVYWLYDCAAEFYETLPETVAYEYADSTYHLKTTSGGNYCCFCYGTNHSHSSKLEKHDLERTTVPQLANQRFVVKDACTLCEYEKVEYVGAKSVIASYYGVVDGQPHTITASDLSEPGVSTSIRYGNSAESCTMTSAPNYSTEGQYTVYYEITYTYKNVDMVESGVAYVWLRDESGNGGTGDSATCTHSYVYHDSVAPTCLVLGYDRYLCPKCGSIEKKSYTNALGHQWQAVVIRDATCEVEGKTMEICHRCGEVKVTAIPMGEHKYESHKVAATCTAPGYTVKECSVCGDRHITDITALAAHSFKTTITAPTCVAQGYTTKTCQTCGLVIHTDYTAKLDHKLGDWILDKPATVTEEGSKHKECENCGQTTETETVPKLKNQAITDGNGEAVVGSYTVIVTDTDTAKGVIGATVSLSDDNKISVLLPSGRLIDDADQSTVTVLITETKAPVKDMSVSVADVKDNYSAGKTDANGQLIVPGTSSVTNGKGDVTVGNEDEDGNRFTITVKVEDYESGRPIKDAAVSVSKARKITVVLPDGTDMDTNNRIAVTVTDNKGKPQKDMNVTVKNDLGKSESGKTNADGKLTVPASTKVETHTAYVVGYNDGGFHADANMSRAEAATVFARLLAAHNGDRLSVYTNSAFKDVQTGAWYFNYVNYAQACGIVAGDKNAQYRPDDKITRAEFVTMCVRFYAAIGGADKDYDVTDFTDVESRNYWAVEYIRNAAKNGWINGYPDGSFKPEQNITRAEVVKIVNAVLGRCPDKTYINNSASIVKYNDLAIGHWAYYEIMEASKAHTTVAGCTAETWAK